MTAATDVGRTDRRRTARAARRPRIAIVIDDLGDSLETARKVLALEPAVTVAVIPFRDGIGGGRGGGGGERPRGDPAPAARAGARRRDGRRHAGFSGRPWRPTLSRTNSSGSARRPVHRRRERPHGLAVHERSARDAHACSRALRERGLFFLDSKTSPESVAAEIAARTPGAVRRTQRLSRSRSGAGRGRASACRGGDRRARAPGSRSRSATRTRRRSQRSRRGSRRRRGTGSTSSRFPPSSAELRCRARSDPSVDLPSNSS